CLFFFFVFFFFFQAEDGIRDFHVTGVQTCALPIYALMPDDRRFSYCMGILFIRATKEAAHVGRLTWGGLQGCSGLSIHDIVKIRSEERRVGKECRSRWPPYQ